MGCKALMGRYSNDCVHISHGWHVIL